MRVHLINPSDMSFGVAVITPRWLYVLAAATGTEWGDPHLVDETITRFDPSTIASGDVVGVGIHSGNALRGYEVGRLARERGAWVVFGGIHATLFPDEPREFGGAHSVVKGDGDVVWANVVRACVAGLPEPVYEAGRIAGDHFVSARWDLMPPGAYMWASVQTVRGCPKHCSFCSVWRTDGQEPRQRGGRPRHPRDRRAAAPRVPVHRARRRQLLSGDAGRSRRGAAAVRSHAAAGVGSAAPGTVRPDGAARAAARRSRPLHADHDGSGRRPAFLGAMRKARIKGALVGVESVTAEGLKDVYKGFNLAGDALVDRLRAFRRHGVHVLGSFIFGLPSDRQGTFDTTVALADRADITFAQFVLLTPFPGTVDFEKWAGRQMRRRSTACPVTRHWLIPQHRRPKVYSPHPTLSAEEIRVGTQRAWDNFYSWRRVWVRSRVVKSMRSRVAFMLVSKLYRQMYANTGIATDSARRAIDQMGALAGTPCAAGCSSPRRCPIWRFPKTCHLDERPRARCFRCRPREPYRRWATGCGAAAPPRCESGSAFDDVSILTSPQPDHTVTSRRAPVGGGRPVDGLPSRGVACDTAN